MLVGIEKNIEQMINCGVDPNILMNPHILTKKKSD